MLATVCAVLMFVGLVHIERQFLVEIPSKGGSLVEGAVGHPRFINPLLALTDADRDLVALTYAGLMGYDKDGLLVPVLAETYSVSESADVYSFTLREHAVFSDGSPVTAEDVVFTVTKAQDPGLKSTRLADFANIHVEAVDARTVRFTLPKPYTPFLEDATLGILPSRVWRNVTNEEFPFSPYMGNPIGAGPFKVVSVSRDKDGAIEEYKLARFEKYALGAPYLSHITFKYFASDEELEEALRRGSVESAYGVVASGVLSAPYSRVFGVFFNQTENPAFARLEVRKALSLALDRNALVAQVLGGYAVPATGPVPNGLLEQPVQQLAGIEEARKVLIDGGWEYDGEIGIWKHAKAGLELSVTLTTSSVPELKAVAEQVKRDFEKLGVPTSLEFHDPNNLVLNVIRPRAYEALLFGMVIGKDKDLFAFWDSSQRDDPGLNVSMYANRSVDQLLDEIRENRDPALVQENLLKLNTIISEEYPAVFTHSPSFLYALPPDLRGVSLVSIAAPSDRLSGAAFWYRHTEYVLPVFTQ
ncbi:peptide ABC transporter substrate-binding protein [Candidatus Parcubacteria bacterium]|nr:peptide ABC transporter substrate-binding protein [Candidatus Parcubacteria bacterium]